MVEHMVTTIDNPWHPFTHFKEWNEYDRDMGYCTNERLATYIFTSDDLGENEKASDIETAQQMLIDADILGIYIKVTKDTVIRPIPMHEYLEMIGADISDLD